MLPNSQNSIQRLARLIEISRNLNKPLELEPFLQAIVNAIAELTVSEAGSVLMLEEETNLLKFVAAPSNQKEALRRLRVPLENSIAGLCFIQSRPVIIHDGAVDIRIDREIDQVLNFETNSLLAVPLTYRGKVMGVVEAVNKKGKAHYTEEDVTILETLAAQTAITIANHALSDKLQRTSQDMEELDRMKSNFIAIASHELRTPLGLVLGHATILRETITDPPQLKQIEVIINSALRLKNIIEDLGNVDRYKVEKKQLQKKKIALDQLILEVVEAYRSQARSKRIALLTDLPDGNLIVEGDTEKIGIALSNLIKNAISFTNENGHVLVSAENLPGYVKVSIVDDGIGVPSKDVRRIFDRFFQVEAHMTRRHGGMGLGLSVAKVMVELHGGQIWVESVEGRGSNFSFLLPTGGQTQTIKNVFAG